MSEYAFQHGDLVEDTLTGFSGIVIANASYMAAGDSVLVKPRGLKDSGGMFDSKWFDVERVKLVTAGAFSLG